LINVEAAIAAITHEVRQPLTAISTKSAAGRRCLGREPPDIDHAQALFADVASAVVRTDEVLKSVRALFERTNREQHAIYVNELIFEAIQIMRMELTQSDIIVDTQLTHALPTIKGDKNQLQEVLLNLIQNSIDAMRTITSRTRAIRFRTELQGTETVVISVEDSGPGIGSEKMTSIFDAFVTTKTSGMGLGLAISQMIIERHSGQIVVVPNANGGAHFRIMLPVKTLTR
jgi:C4-dicarboxylate-specific signal transduction histidine kinase